MGLSTPSIEDEIDRLFRLPLREFVSERNAISVRLAREGDHEASKRVKALAKPSVSAWAVNQLYWNARETYEALIRAGDDYRTAQGASLAGGGGAEALHEAEETRKVAVREAMERAEEILVAGGQKVGTMLERRLTTSLEALASYGSSLADPPNGRLTADLQPPGFATLSALANAAPARNTPATESSVPPAPHELERIEERRRAEATVAERREALEAAEEATSRAEEVVRTAQNELEGARKRYERAEAALTRAEIQLEKARVRVEEEKVLLEVAEQASRDLERR